MIRACDGERLGRRRIMLRPFSTLRLRLTLTYMLVFGLIQAAVCMAILVQRERRDIIEFDALLLEQARAVGKLAATTGQLTGTRLDVQEIGDIVGPFDDAVVYSKVLLLDGTVVASTRMPARTPWKTEVPPIDELRRQRALFETVDDESIQRLVGASGGLRVVHRYHVPDVGTPVIVQVGTGLSGLKNEQTERRRMFLMMSLLALVPAGLTTWLLAKRSLRSLTQVAEQVQVISPRGLNQRISVSDPPGELVQLTETVNQMLDRLDKAFHAQDRFLTNAAHELKTPLSILMGEAQVLRNRSRTVEEYERYLCETEIEMRRLGKTVDGLLMLARAQSRDPERQPVSVNEFVTAALERCQPLARNSKVRLVPRLLLPEEGETEPIVLGDSRLLVTMLENLVRNAVRLSFPNEPVEVEVNRGRSEALIVVRDRGPGIPDLAEATMFDDFLTREVDGRASGDTGIGLGLARSVVHLYEGSITVRNRPEGGAEFIVRLPLANESGDPAQSDTGQDNWSGA